ncbi:hypothetical protein ACJZ2D_014304 [Fusarium nematophilum]
MSLLVSPRTPLPDSPSPFPDYTPTTALQMLFLNLEQHFRQVSSEKDGAPAQSSTILGAPGTETLPKPHPASAQSTRVQLEPVLAAEMLVEKPPTTKLVVYIYPAFRSLGKVGHTNREGSRGARKKTFMSCFC